jgi:Ca2+-binding EF-hand superfamily protein
MSTLLLLALLNAAPPPEDDTHDLVLFAHTRPYRIRLHLRLAGQSYQHGWNRQMGRLYAYLDVDGDGKLSPAEAARAPSQEQWRQMSSGQGKLAPDPSPSFDDLSRGKKIASVGDLQTYYASSTAGPLQTLWAWPGGAGDPLGEALWKKLDSNRDGKLSKEELLAARRVLAKLDLDDDDVISGSELLEQRFFASPSLVMTAGPAHGAGRGGLPFYSVRPDASSMVVARALITRYDRDNSDTLSNREIGFSREQFASLDRNRDGQLDAVEMVGWTALPADLELVVPLEGADHPIRVLAGPLPGLRVATTRAGEAILVEDWHIDLFRPRPLLPRERVRSNPAVAEFDALDSDGNGYLNSREIYHPPFKYVPWMRLADRDGDGKLSKKEFTAFADLQASILGRVTFLQVADLRRSLFRFMDENGDGRLGIREMNQVGERLTRWNPKGTVFDRGSLPYHYRLTLGYGVLDQIPRGTGELRQLPLYPPARGPLWFRKMDRNGDGDVSRREFLGTAEQFRAIDSDADGLISHIEAEHYDQQKRKAND